MLPASAEPENQVNIYVSLAGAPAEIGHTLAGLERG